MMKKHTLIIAVIVLFTFLSACTASLQEDTSGSVGTEVTSDNVRTVSIPGFKDTVDAEHLSISDSGLEVCRIGTYTGIFVEQGTDIECRDIPAIIVHNATHRTIEKAVLVQGSQTFAVTMLPPGGICLVQSQSGKPAQSSAELHNLVFREPVQFVADDAEAQNRVRVEAENNLITIENISGEDIPGSVNVWYKTIRNGLYIGGISYKAAVDHGILKAGSTATVQTAHYDPAHSELLAVTFTE